MRSPVKTNYFLSFSVVGCSEKMPLAEKIHQNGKKMIFFKEEALCPYGKLKKNRSIFSLGLVLICQKVCEKITVLSKK